MVDGWVHSYTWNKNDLLLSRSYNWALLPFRRVWWQSFDTHLHSWGYDCINVTYKIPGSQLLQLAPFADATLQATSSVILLCINILWGMRWSMLPIYVILYQADWHIYMKDPRTVRTIEPNQSNNRAESIDDTIQSPTLWPTTTRLLSCSCKWYSRLW